MKLSKKIGFLLFGVVILFLYRFFISTAPLVAHDWPLLFRESRNFPPFFNIAWDYGGSAGLGSSAFKTLWIDLYTNIVYAVSNIINLPWWFSQRIFWIAPFLLLTISSSYIFSGLFIKNYFYRLLSVLIYSCNTYILLIVAGGQFGVAFAYGLSPLVFYIFIQFFNNQNIRNAMKLGLLSGILVALDPRVALVVFFGAFFYSLFYYKNYKLNTFKLILASLAISFVVNFYWLFPIILTRNALTNIADYSSSQGVKFLSFADFSNSLSLLHPNWPENIFGKVYFFRPEFLIIPILAFLSLLTKAKKELLFFATLVLVGAFLGKGTNDPFGLLYLFFFQYVPGFTLFRDSTKFFILVAISYSILIPYLLQSFTKFKHTILICFIAFWLSTLVPAYSGQLTGIFKPKPIPSEYILLKNTLIQDKFFYRVLWTPQREKYGFFDPFHPAFEPTKIPDINLLSDLSVRYIVIPDDIDSEIFLKDRKYNKDVYQKTINNVKQISNLKPVSGFGNIKVFENPNYKDHFWSPSTTLRINYKFISPTKYEIDIRNVKKGDLLVFSEGWDPNWQASNNSFLLKSKPYEKLLNSFELTKDGNYSMNVYYAPQKLANIGMTISATFLLFLVLAILAPRVYNGKKK